MEIQLSEVKNLKIVPEKYESSTVFDVVDINESKVKINLPLITEFELKDYIEGEQVEMFGLNKTGLVYFTSEILNKNGKEIIIKYPEDIKQIQRRKYSRVPYDGKLEIKGKENIKVKAEDISAGGLKFTADTPFMVGDEYEIRVELANNLIVNCTMQPIRVEETEDSNALPYAISAKFKKIRSIDRIALMQYSLRLISELENKS